jgi:hypothetical protein
MTTIWVQTPIESTEQISLLPDTAILTTPGTDGPPIALVRAGELDGHPVWEVTGRQGIEFEARLIHWGTTWIALTPTEVEVEQIRETTRRRRRKTLYITPWQHSAHATDPGDDAEALADCADQA